MRQVYGISVIGLAVCCGTALAEFHHLRWDENPQIRGGVAVAIQRLERRPQCASIFGGNGVDILTSANYRFAPLGKVRTGMEIEFRVIAATTLSEFNLVLINSEGPFSRPGMSIHNSHFNYPERFNFGLRGDDFRALVLLHELGHLAGVFKPDGSDPKLNRLYTELVLNACFR